MELNEIRVENFKKIRDARLSLSGLNILVGANGSGKSSILQAIHLASCLMRQAAEVRSDKTSAIGISELDYLPTDSYAQLGHNANWGNRAGTPSSKVTFQFADEAAGRAIAYSEFRSARNAGISVTGSIPTTVSRMYRGLGTFFSAYIPGISGIPNQEPKQSKRVVLKACSFGDANVYLRNALNLLSTDEIAQLQNWLSDLIGPARIAVEHNDARDLVITARAWINGRSYPLELLGMGYLQLIQIFCYVLLFKPRILLIDEPDIHLHPDVQERLSVTLSRVASERQIKVLLSTHSPFIVRGAPIDANVFWIENGVIQESTRQSVELSLGWGAFGKKIIVVSEDAGTSLLEKLLSQWPEIENFTTIHPGRGYGALLKPDQACELYETLGRKYKIVVHRDRDSLTDDEVANLEAQYAFEGVSIWVTDESDIEAYFCGPQFLSDLLEVPEAEARQHIDAVIDARQQPIRDQFASQRAAHNKELHAAGGSPENEDVWRMFQNNVLRGAKGKFVFGQLKNQIPGNSFSELAVLKHELNGALAHSLRTHLEAQLRE
tara:strand:- start:15798 stop:17447 length:1650 start_codon:yes stop_codon:yes gene_type:complete